MGKKLICGTRNSVFFICIMDFYQLTAKSIQEIILRLELVIWAKNGDVQEVIRRRPNYPLKNTDHVICTSVAFLLYVSRITNQLGSLLLKHKMKAIFKDSSKIFPNFPNSKEQITFLLAHSIYKISSAWYLVYIDETVQWVKTGLSKQKPYKGWVLTYSAVMKHHE